MMNYIPNRNNTSNPHTLTCHLFINNEIKPAEYEIIRQGNEKWKKCKLLGSRLDTEKDVKRRKCLAMDTCKTLDNILIAEKSESPSKSEHPRHMLHCKCIPLPQRTVDHRLNGIHRGFMGGLVILHVFGEVKIDTNNSPLILVFQHIRQNVALVPPSGDTNIYIIREESPIFAPQRLRF